MTSISSLYLATDGFAGLQEVIAVLRAKGYQTIGPVVRGAVMLAEVHHAGELARGVSDVQEKGSYRLDKNESAGFFAHNLGPMSWKTFLFPPRSKLWSVTSVCPELNEAKETPTAVCANKAHKGGFDAVIPANSEQTPTKEGRVLPNEMQEAPLAFIGVRACDAAAIAVQDRVFLCRSPESHYAARRRKLFILTVHCSTAARTCFCPSLGTGPEFPFDSETNDFAAGEENGLEETKRDGTAHGSGDIACTPGKEAGSFYFRALSRRGKEVLEEVAALLAPEKFLSCSQDSATYLCHVQQVLRRTKDSIVRSMDQKNIKNEIAARLGSNVWQAFGDACLGCANCTLVCPTCFCSSISDSTAVSGSVAERFENWDSCFNIDFSYTHGGARRESVASRYRQWFSHKFSSWHDQFGSSGCVGCGRCIAWCPVGIDVTESLLTLKKEGRHEE